MKLLLYCTKAKPYLYDFRNILVMFDIYDVKQAHFDDLLLNGKIVAECDFEVEEITLKFDDYEVWIESNTDEDVILKQSCLDSDKLYNYLGGGNGDRGYAIHIKNLHIFDKPRELDFYSSNFDYFKKVEKAHQNMMKVWEDQESPRVLISIRPEWLCKILNGEKTIEIRKKVLKEMLE